jgi:hypothetical protein
MEFQMVPYGVVDGTKTAPVEGDVGSCMRGDVEG